MSETLFIEQAAYHNLKLSALNDALFEMKKKKEALIVLGISIPILCYGAFSFELEGTSSTIEAIAVALAVTLGLFGVGIGMLMLFTKTSLEIFNEKKSKPIIKKEKEMPKIKDAITKEKPVKKSGSESIELMQREKALVNRWNDLNTLLDEVRTELDQARTSLETKGWIKTEEGWVID